MRTHHLRSDKFILKKPLDNILQGWKPSDADLFAAAEVEIPELLSRVFELAGIGYRQSNGKHFAPWTKEVAPGWMKLFLWLLSKCKDYIQLSNLNNKVSPDIEKGVTALKSLQSLVGTGGFKSLLVLESVKAILDREMLNPRSGTIILNSFLILSITPTSKSTSLLARSNTVNSEISAADSERLRVT